MLKTLTLTLTLLGLSTVARAQTNCPSNLPPATPTISSTLSIVVFACTPQADNVIGINLYGLPAGKIVGTAFTVLSTPYGDGKVLVRASFPAQPKGTYTLDARGVNLLIPGDPTSTQEGPSSSPFVLSVVDPVNRPSALGNISVTKGP